MLIMILFYVLNLLITIVFYILNLCLSLDFACILGIIASFRCVLNTALLLSMLAKLNRTSNKLTKVLF